MGRRTDEETNRFLDSVGVEVLDPRSSHRQFRCRACGATWRPRRELSGRLRREDWICWRGCNSAAAPGENGRTGSKDPQS